MMQMIPQQLPPRSQRCCPPARRPLRPRPGTLAGLRPASPPEPPWLPRAPGRGDQASPAASVGHWRFVFGVMACVRAMRGVELSRAEENLPGGDREVS